MLNNVVLIGRAGKDAEIREICSALGLRSTSTIWHHLSGLAERGLILWDHRKNRAIQITPAGYEALGVETPACPHCHGTGRT